MIGRTCSAPSGTEQDKRQRAGGVARGRAGRKVPRVCPRASTTPSARRGPPLSLLGKGKGGEPKATTLAFFRERSVWGDRALTFEGGRRGEGFFREKIEPYRRDFSEENARGRATSKARARALGENRVLCTLFYSREEKARGATILDVGVGGATTKSPTPTPTAQRTTSTTTPTRTAQQ